MRGRYRWIKMKATSRDSNHSTYDNNLSDNEYYINRLFIVLTLERERERERNYRFDIRRIINPRRL